MSLYTARTIGGQMALLENAIGNISDKLRDSRDNKNMREVNHYTGILQSMIDEWKELNQQGVN